MKKEKLILTPKWLEIKSMFEANTNGSKEYNSNFPVGGELDILTEHFIGMLSNITLNEGFDVVVEGVKMDTWKERIWSVIENGGLLPNIAWRDEMEDEDIEEGDDWGKVEEYDELDEDDFDAKILNVI
jgi:hypothetical protein